MWKAKHEPTGLTPAPVSRRLRLSDQEEAKEEIEEMMVEKSPRTSRRTQGHEGPDCIPLSTTGKCYEIESTKRNRDSWMVHVCCSLGGVGAPRHATRGPNGPNGFQKRWIKEVAKRAGISNLYYRDWLCSHHTRGEALSPITIVTVTQPWQRSKLFDLKKACRDRQTQAALLSQRNGRAGLEPRG